MNSLPGIQGTLFKELNGRLRPLEADAANVPRELTAAQMTISVLPGDGSPELRGGERDPAPIQGTFWVHGGPVLGRESRPPGMITDEREVPPQNDAIVIDGSRISINSGCPPVAAKFKTSKEGMRVSARWPECGNVARNLHLDAVIDAETGGTMIGSVKGLMQTEIVKDFVTGFIATTATGDALRIGTYNVQFLPGGFGNDGSPCGFSGPDDETRPVRIAERIKKSGYDIIALNEVFDEESRGTFLLELMGTYPHYVAYLTDITVTNEDSDLMLFSRFPFEPLPYTAFQVPSGNCWAIDCSKVAFYVYAWADGDDAMSDKGVGFVRIRNPQTNRIYNVLFTHMQVSYPGEDGETDAYEHFNTRGIQLNNYVAALYGTTLDDNQKQTEDVFFMGDLNIDGDLTDPDLGEDALNGQNRHEWVVRFGSPGSFFHDTLRDAWAFESSPADRGLTNLRAWEPYAEDAGACLDYHDNARFWGYRSAWLVSGRVSRIVTALPLLAHPCKGPKINGLRNTL